MTVIFFFLLCSEISISKSFKDRKSFSKVLPRFGIFKTGEGFFL